MPAVAFYTRNVLEASAFGIGLLTSIFFIARALSAVISGRLSDKYKQKTLYLPIISFFLNAFAVYTYSYAINLSQILFIRFIQGILNGLAWVPIQTILGLSVKYSIRGRVYSAYFIAGSLGVMGGNMLYAVISKEPLRYILLISTIAFLISSFLTLIIKCKIKTLVTLESKEEVKLVTTELPRQSYSSIISKIEIFSLLIIVLGVGFFNSVTRGDLIYIYMNEYLRLEKSLVASFIALASLFGLLLSYPISWISDKYTGRYALKIALLSCVFGALILSIEVGWISILSLALVYTGAASIVPIARKIGVSHPTSGGIIIGLINALANAGNVLGSALAGYLYDILPRSIKIINLNLSPLIIVMSTPIIVVTVLTLILSPLIKY